MLRGWAVLLTFQLIGEVITRAIGWAIPGPVIGMALLLGALQLRLLESEGLRAVSSGLLSHLSLLFVPAGVGVMLHAHRLVAEWPALTASVLVSTAATIGITGWIADRFSGASGDGAAGDRTTGDGSARDGAARPTPGRAARLATRLAGQREPERA